MAQVLIAWTSNIAIKQHCSVLYSTVHKTYWLIFPATNVYGSGETSKRK